MQEDGNMDKIVYTGGSFDTTHIGHVNFLRQCAMLGKVIVSLNTDDFIRSYKGSEPIFSYEERKRFLEILPYVDKVIPNIGGADSKQAIELVNPDIIAIATDWASKDYYKQMGFTQKWLDKKGILLVYLPYFKGISTTQIKDLCKK